MENQHILQVHQTPVEEQVQQNRDELDAGMKLIGYEDFDIDFDNDDARTYEILAYKNETKVVVFYNRPEQTIAMKVFDLTKGLTKTTAHFPMIGISDIRTILTMFWYDGGIFTGALLSSTSHSHFITKKTKKNKTRLNN